MALIANKPKDPVHLTQASGLTRGQDVSPGSLTLASKQAQKYCLKGC